MPERFEVTAKEADQRLDKLLRQHFPELGFGATQKLIRGGRVRVNGKRAKAAQRIGAGAIITLPFQGGAQGERRAERAEGRAVGAEQHRAAHSLTALKLYEDASLLILNKPQGLAVQGGSGVQQHVAKMIAGSDLRLVHRLDRETSGVLVLAKGALNAKLLSRAFADQGVSKAYLALIPPTQETAGTVTLPLAKVLIGGEGRMAVHPGGQAAVTDFWVRGTGAGEGAGEEAGEGAGATLVELRPRTGRTHQLRVHCAQIFGGIYGDDKYGEAGARAASLRLHAWQITLAHPDTGEAVHIKAPLPAAFEADLDRLGLRLPQTWSPA